MPDQHTQDTGPRRCWRCGCTDDDCTACIEATGQPCTWVSDDECSRCVTGTVIQARDITGPINL